MAGEILGLSVLALLVIIGSSLLYLVMQYAVKIPGVMLRQKFISLGDMKGKSLASIAQVVGPPQSSSSIPDGKILHQWLKIGYHIALVFENDICEGISHEASA